MKTIAFAAVAAALCASSAVAQDLDADIRTYFDENVSAWMADPVITTAIIEQNARTAGLSADEIEALDQTWRAEVGSMVAPMVDEVTTNAVSDYLRDRIGASDGMITEVIIMDAVGLNVGVNTPTSDYFQGDEAKYLETFPNGAGHLHIGDLEFDESTHRAFRSKHRWRSSIRPPINWSV